MTATRRWSIRVLTTLTALAVPVLAPAAPATAAACGPSIDAPMPERPWPLRRLRPDLVWPVTQGENVVVAVIDSGVSPEHPALAGQVLPGVDFVEPGQPGHCDLAAHGTMIAGIIAGKPTSTSGFTGMAPAARILPIRVLATGERTFEAELPPRIAAAIRLATDRGVDVINLSLTTQPFPELTEAVRYAVSKDVVIVAATGNDGESQQDEQPVYPAAYDGVIGVAGIDERGDRVPTSPLGDYVDVAAPGLEIAAPAPQGGGYAYKKDGGTSYAAAYVSGVAALIRASDPKMPAREVADRIARTADHPPNGWDRAIGHGVVNPYWAITSISAARARPAGGQERSDGLRDPVPAPEDRVRSIAMLTAFGAVVAALLVLVAAHVVRRGRSRGWRPGRPAPSE